jgi:hypothetical protein
MAETMPQEKLPIASPVFTARVEIDLELNANDAEHALELVNRHLRITPGECQRITNQSLYVKECRMAEELEGKANG